MNYPSSTDLIFPNQYKYSQIRHVFQRRIYGYLYSLAQTLNNQIVFLADSSIPDYSDTSHKELGKFNQETNDDNKRNQIDSGNNDSGENGDESDTNSSDEDSPSKKALIYARVSGHKQTSDDSDEQTSDDSDEQTSDESDEQTSDESDDDDTPDKGSIEGQIEELKTILDNMDLELAHDPIIDKAQSGTDFDREGIQKVFELAQREEIGYLLVEKVDRIGRSAPETLYFIYLLQSECDVRLITTSGERDIESIHGLMHTTLLSLMAEVQNTIRTSKAKKERVRNFVNKKDWYTYSRIIPIGYNEEDNWLTPDPDEVKIVRDLFETFNDPDCQTYAETERQINDKYDDILDGHSVKTLLTNPVYIGRPQIPEEWVVDLPYDNVVEDEDLQIIDEDTFERTQEIIDEKDQKHSTDKETRDIGDFVEEFGLISVVYGSEPATLVHDCGEPMTVKNGQAKLGGGMTHRFYCPECDESRKWPQEYENRRMRFLQLLLDEELSFNEALDKVWSVSDD